MNCVGLLNVIITTLCTGATQRQPVLDNFTLVDDLFPAHVTVDPHTRTADDLIDREAQFDGLPA